MYRHTVHRKDKNNKKEMCVRNSALEWPFLPGCGVVPCSYHFFKVFVRFQGFLSYLRVSLFCLIVCMSSSVPPALHVPESIVSAWHAPPPDNRQGADVGRPWVLSPTRHASLLVGIGVLVQRRDCREVQPSGIVGCVESGDRMEEDQNQQAEFEPAVAQSGGCWGTQRGPVLTRRVASFQRPHRAVVWVDDPSHVTALRLRLGLPILWQSLKRGIVAEAKGHEKRGEETYTQISKN